MRRTTFAEFGTAMVREVVTPAFLRRHLTAVLDAALDRSELLARLGVRVVALRVPAPDLLADDGWERSFAVTVEARLESGVGPRILGIGVDAVLEVDLLVRLRVFLPSLAEFDVDPVTRSDVRLRGRARGGVLRFPLFEGGDVARLAGAVGASPTGVLDELNRAIAESAARRRIDVLRLWRDSLPTERWDGVLDPGQRRLWPFDLPAWESAELHVWAGIVPPEGAGAGDAPTELELAVGERDGTTVDRVGLTVRRVAPDLDTTATGSGVTVSATSARRPRARLVNNGPRPVSYRIELCRHAVMGGQVDFSRFGTELLVRGIDPRTVTALVGPSLTGEPTAVAREHPLPLRGEVTSRLVSVAAHSGRPDVLRFTLTVDADADLVLRPDTAATPLAVTVRLRVGLRVFPLVEPAALAVEVAPVRVRDVRVTGARLRMGERSVRLPAGVLGLAVRGRIAGELDRRLGGTGREFVLSELADRIPAGVADPDGRPERLSFSGVAELGQPGSHGIQVVDRQRFQVKARVVGDAAHSARDEDSTGANLVAELALCDEHGGVWAAEQAPVPTNGRPGFVGLEFTAPRAGTWRLRLASVGRPGDLEYELRVRADN